jgi:hypothetical protein
MELKRLLEEVGMATGCVFVSADVQKQATSSKPGNVFLLHGLCKAVVLTHSPKV